MDRLQGSLSIFFLVVVVLGFQAPATPADEGMWTFQNPPLKLLKERYGFTPTRGWLDHVRLSSVRINDGGSGSFVSPSGLVMTNHHVVHGQLAKLSTRDRNLAEDGYHARTRAAEIPCPDLELNVLVQMIDITGRVNGVVESGSRPEEAARQRRAEIARIEKESTARTGLRSEGVRLYAGAEYWLYRYKKYTDVRLVFAPEKQAAFFGGDFDNFTYPRFCLDMSFVRAYEDGKPARTPHFLAWKREGAREGELVFVSGNPGRTQRLFTLRQLEYERDVAVPRRLAVYHEVEKALQAYASRSAEHRRKATYLLDGFANARKAYQGMKAGLDDPALLKKKARAEADFLKRVAGNPELSGYQDAWTRIAAALKDRRVRDDTYFFTNLRGARLARFALTIVQCVAEVEKANTERLPAYRDSALESLKRSLFSRIPTFPDLEGDIVAAQFRVHARWLSEDSALRKALVGDRTPAAAAAAYYEGTRLGDAGFRKTLVEGGSEAVAKCNDPLLDLARKLDTIVRDHRKWYQDRIGSVLLAEGARIAKARFAVFGKDLYPDANFTLRLTFGRVASYGVGTTVVPAHTTFYGLFDRFHSMGGKFPFLISKRIRAARHCIDLETPLNFVSTCDIIGGNSGSPVINRDAEVVGLIFDGNIQSLPGDYIFDGSIMRAVSVHSAGIIEALSKAYEADELVQELLWSGR